MILSTIKKVNGSAAKNGILFGLLVVIALLLTTRYTLTEDSKYTGNWLTTGLSFGIIASGILFCFNRLARAAKTEKLGLKQMIIASIIFSITAGLAGGLYHYINAAFLDTGYAEKALEAAQAKWAAANYTHESITGQMELTNAFQNPAKWAVVSGLFMCTCAFLLSLVMGGLFNSIKGRKRQLHSA
jgi:hypothetical protein